MRTHLTRLLTGLAATGLAAGMLTATAGAAAAAGHHPAARQAVVPDVSCHGFSCHGHDPQVYGCTASSQKAAYYYSGRTLMATLTSYYSYTCNANWTDGQLSNYAVGLGWNFGITVSTTDSQNKYEYMCWSGPNDPNNTGALDEYCIPHPPPYYNGPHAWTDMVDGTNLTYSGMSVYDAYGNLIVRLTVTQ